ncbi:MAG: UDP-N-acetylglucosamine 2-epimerase (non-hydrolyzing) [Bacteroidales bacterium]
MKIVSVVGARPNFMKISPFIRAIENHNNSGRKKIEHILVHTGQHYDDRMSKNFFAALGIPDADIHLDVGSGTHAEQVGRTMMAFEKVLRAENPDWVVVVGDVNATLACSVTAKKEHVKCCHIEAGLRSGDIDMPEEVNRLVTDRLSDLLLTPDKISIQHLKAEGTDERRIKFVGNIMIDTLETERAVAGGLKIEEIIASNSISQTTEKVLLEEEGYALVTLHRPSNVDDMNVLKPIVDFLAEEVTGDMPLVWSIHPRSLKQLEEFDLLQKITDHKKIHLLHPLGYHEMLRLNMTARLILTDSGGLQEECTILGTPCLTLRWNTERPVTLREHGGASVLVGNNIDRIRREYRNTLTLKRTPLRPELWDGHTAERCLRAILEHVPAG